MLGVPEKLRNHTVVAELPFSAEDSQLGSYGFLRELVDEAGLRAPDDVAGLRAEEELVAGLLTFGAVLAGVLDRTGALRVGAGRTPLLLEAGDGRRTVVDLVALRAVGLDLEVEPAEGIDLLVTGVTRRAVAGVERDVGVDLLVMGVARRAVGV